MTGTSITDVADFVDEVRDLYQDDPELSVTLDEYRARLREPLRLAIAGIVKAGKSTLLNALIGEQIAPTDAGECTRTITWYRYAPTPSITVHLRDGGVERRPVRRVEGRLVLDLGGRTAEEVAWIDVGWPSENLRGLVLIDTPGIASLTAANSQRSTSFLLPQDAPSAADAIVYLLRHVHAADVRFLEAFRDTAAGVGQTVNAVAVLSRADEVGSGRIDSLLSAAKIADRYRRDRELRSLALDVIPVAGLLAEGGRTLRESEFIVFRNLAGLDREARERLLVSVDRFTRPTDDTSVSVDARRALLARFGLFGVRLGAALVRGGARTSSELAERLVQQSGLIELQRFVAQQFRSRAFALKARGILQGIDDVLRENPRPGGDALLGVLERLTSRSHDLRELSLLAELRTDPPRLDESEIEEAERIVGGAGTSVVERLGLAEGTGRAECAERADQLLARWRSLSESPLTDRHTASFCRMVVRSVEGIVSQLPGRSTGDIATAPDVLLAGSPSERAG
ncbi:dynamin family protein [Microbacterium sp. P05]|uniref:dynamin family protein n=1 Tax=Microbacterium sp. P05 TaxID=3366948 RepID=UPI0037456ED7